VLTDRGTEYCGAREHHEYELYPAVEDIDHTKIKAKSPQTNGIYERFNRTVQNEFYAIVCRKKIYQTLEQLQNDLDSWIDNCNFNRTYSGKYCFGKTPMTTFIDSIKPAKEKYVEQLNNTGIAEHNNCTENDMNEKTVWKNGMNDVFLQPDSDNFLYRKITCLIKS
jgi:hypothetical protein